MNRIMSVIFHNWSVSWRVHPIQFYYILCISLNSTKSCTFWETEHVKLLSSIPNYQSLDHNMYSICSNWSVSPDIHPMYSKYEWTSTNLYFPRNRAKCKTLKVSITIIQVTALEYGSYSRTDEWVEMYLYSNFVGIRHIYTFWDTDLNAKL